MENTERIQHIREAFVHIKPGLSASSLGEAIRSLAGDVNRLTTSDKDLNLKLKKIAADLRSSYTSQLQYSELRNKSEHPGLNVKPEFDSSFFESLGILKTELFDLLARL